VIELSDEQYDFVTSRKKNTGFVAGFGSGKSFAGTMKTLLKIIEDRIPKVAYYLPTYGDIRDIAFDGFPEVCELLGYEYKLNKTDKELKVFDRGEVIGVVMFRNMSEPENIVGYKVGYSLIDETDILNLDKMGLAFKKIIGRNRLIVEVQDEDILEEYRETEIPPEGTYFHSGRKELCYTNIIDVAGTPEGFKWFYKRFVTEKKESDLLINASTYSNIKNLPDDYIDQMRSEYPPNLFNAYVNGIFVNLTSGTVYSYFDRSKHHSSRDAKSTDVLHIGQDFNIGGCVSTIHIIDNDKVYRVDEIVSKDSFGILENIRRVYPENKIIFYPDSSGNSSSTNATKSDIDLIKGSNVSINAPSKNGRVSDRVNSYNGLLSHDRYFINTNKCPKGTEALEQQSWKNNEPEKFNGGATIDDYNDSSGYFVVRKFGITRSRVSNESISPY
jgi:hypothetical protein